MINTAVSFGFLPGVSAWVIAFFWLGLFVYAVKMRELWERIGMGFILLGGAGNIASRILHGGVVDNWNFLGIFYNHGWDWMIGAGVFILIIQTVGRKF